MILFSISNTAWAQDHESPADPHTTTTPTQTHAEVHHPHGPVEIPWTNISVQAFNFIFLLAVLGFLLRKSVAAHFQDRSKSYKDLVDRAEIARKEAERNHIEVQHRLQKLEASSQQTLQRAQGEAEELRAKLIREAKTLSEKLELEAKRTAAIELEKAKADLRRDLLEKAIGTSRENFRKGLGSSEQKRLQNEFALKIEGVEG
jgi:F-type H+-transporting ATPase subunit b